MKNTRETAIILTALWVMTGAAQSFEKNVGKAHLQSNQLVGNWYMGTMCGLDCNLKISSDNTLTVQFGGCFHQDPAIKSRWKLQGDKIKFQNTYLNKSLGSFLRVVKYKNHFVLLPTRPQKHQGQHKYSHFHSFWRNTMKNGLQLSKDAPEG